MAKGKPNPIIYVRTHGGKYWSAYVTFQGVDLFALAYANKPQAVSALVDIILSEFPTATVSNILVRDDGKAA